MKGVGDIGAQEADLVKAARPEEINRVSDHVGDHRKDDALALADQAVDEGPPEGPHDAVLH
eukprot:7422621-Alexandrium_andersonii.AAC.1